MSIAQLASKIDKVKVYAEGSTVIRSASLSSIVWSNEQTHTPIEVEVVGLPLALDDASVRVRVVRLAPTEREIEDQVIVTDVRVGLSVPPPTAIPISDLTASIQSERDGIDRLKDLLNAIALELSVLDALNVPNRPIGQEGKAPPTSPTAARLALANFKDEQKQLRLKEKREIEKQLRQAEEHLADLQQQQILASNAHLAKKHELRKTIVASLQIQDSQNPQDRQEASSESISSRNNPPLNDLHLMVEYFVQGAKWVPTYVCRLNSANNTAAIALRALICQRTGEDWSGVKIELSTATPTGWCELPELPTLRLGREQTFTPPKAWRSPPKGAELLFEDYDVQKQIAANAIGALDIPNHLQIPILQPLSSITQSIDIQDMSSYGIDSFTESSRKWNREENSMALGVHSTEFDEISEPFGKAGVEVDTELEELRFSIQKDRTSRGGMASTIERMEKKEISSEAMAPQQVMSKAMAPPRSSLQSVPLPSTTIPESIFDPSQEIKNYGLMRLAEPDNHALRGKLRLTDVTTIYLESLRRSQITVNFDLSMVLQKASLLAACSTIPLPLGTTNVREMVGAFDFAYLGTSRVDIPSDGQFHSIALREETAEIDLRYIVVPREDPHVFRIAQLRNPLRSPLLAGSTDVYVDGEYILSTRINTVPPQGQMELGLGVEQSIKVARNTSFKEVRSGMSLVAFSELRHSIHIAIANRLGRNARIEVRERIPVPQADVKVDVTVTQVSPAWEKYDQQERNAVVRGGYRWQINVPAGGETELTADYTIKTFVDNELINGNRREQ
ncbi:MULTISPECIES: DUF4139 domain-containing protein [Pseudanabaena]|uniref:DUF4139 domain-containing protein n=2 Tax=Pseudanabaena TaxID=1152 RepID=L8MX94_9CYAN|nr:MULTISPECIES: DUF4139 domain-containing protein [Pseudanabaena]ELS31080.1 hypothetical protein Pse7429DRAFT_3333 [Pseudanabaena biceps PCC 7429]MDG3496647.1 DUF4139 domain-containing protein [Pseudanabaena catenata USMAC16]